MASIGETRGSGSQGEGRCGGSHLGRWGGLLQSAVIGRCNLGEEGLLAGQVVALDPRPEHGLSAGRPPQKCHRRSLQSREEESQMNLAMKKIWGGLWMDAGGN